MLHRCNLGGEQETLFSYIKRKIEMTGILLATGFCLETFTIFKDHKHK